jgi:NAD(P)-dependent dehydrogenase (short-subunit alcohol dehydrogenase family)
MNPQICLVTGGTSGIGLMTAVELVKQGNQVFIACRSEQKAQQAINYIIAQTNQGKVEFLPLDLASLDSIRACVNLFLERQLPLNILIKCFKHYFKLIQVFNVFNLIQILPLFFLHFYQSKLNKIIFIIISYSILSLKI